MLDHLRQRRQVRVQQRRRAQVGRAQTQEQVEEREQQRKQHLGYCRPRRRKVQLRTGIQMAPLAREDGVCLHLWFSAAQFVLGLNGGIFCLQKLIFGLK
jgi:hypothetical protein